MSASDQKRLHRLHVICLTGTICAIIFFAYFTQQPRLATPLAADILDEDLLRRIRNHNSQQINVTVKLFNTLWQVVNAPYEMYMFSAFYDDRPSLNGPPHVRVVGVSESAIEDKTIYCYVWFGLPTDPYITFARPEHLGAGNYRHGKYFREHLYDCELQTPNVIPKAVSIEYAADNRMKTKHPSTYIKVNVPEKPEAKEDFMVCVSVSFWKIDPYRVIEWMEIHKMWGVNKVTIYNSSIDDESIKVFEQYQKEGFVDLRSAPTFVSDEGEMSILLLMSPVITECLYRNMYKYNKIVVTDLDEMIVPRNTMNYNDMLKAIDQRQPGEHEAKAYVFRNDYFFLDKQMAEDPTMSEKLVTLRHRTRLPPSGPGYSVKSIIDPMSCTRMHNHYCMSRTKGYDLGPHTIDVDTELGMNQHYKKCHFDKYLNKPGECAKMMKDQVKDDTMLRFKDELIERVERKLKEFKLDPL